MSFSIGDRVVFFYKSGKYIGEIADQPGLTKLPVRVLAVLKHPAQGDIHYPGQVDVSMFHQRKALAYQEIAAVPPQVIQPFDGDIPDYEESLEAALNKEITKLEGKQDAYARQALTELSELKKEYFGT
ncbi:sporulation phosphorelay system protein KapB [Paenibacillus larvae]|uniref:Kinase n=4 Tax=Paenibacillus larvae TaxID=1464 RepID=A0A1V0UNG0_9BACL|nr:sporulation phosphorelay system protein KapB [Paenibacillus larvae]AQR77159.1 kinase [Paenibacillus larvae subsp. larvae]ARF66803.1 kinase [Paenibacillus larvae subsp. pulvifaciens]AVF21890.1 kinase-associated lipoprotein B [Paenibacillus larvae subsp. larvae]ETK27335.1 kinase-associated lipoprotein B [Paenibacillus larvae subsp. larvae DSM 25719]MCY7478784.1 kinase-associated lipoprotein B [Paenibacillus larvae]